MLLQVNVKLNFFLLKKTKETLSLGAVIWVKIKQPNPKETYGKSSSLFFFRSNVSGGTKKNSIFRFVLFFLKKKIHRTW